MGFSSRTEGPMKTLKNKVAVVTGSASGIGKAAAIEFARSGMDVALADVDEKGMAAVATEIQKIGRRAICVKVDVTKKPDIENLLKRTLAELGGVHVVMNNAGVTVTGNAWETSDEDWKRVIDIDLWGVIHGCRVFAPVLAKQGEGHIVNTASGAGLMAVPGMVSYTTAKFGVVGLSEGFRYELDSYGVGVTVVCPGVVNTNIMKAAEYKGGYESHRSQIEKMVEDQGVAPEKLAKKIVKAIKGNEPQVLIGREAYAISAMKKMPIGVADRLGKLMAREIKKRAGR